MKTYKLIGITEVSYVKDGKPIEGVTLNLGTEHPLTEGLAVSRVYISNKQKDLYDTTELLEIGCYLRLLYDLNDYGKPVLCSIEVV